jgi:hypothetical protein
MQEAGAGDNCHSGGRSASSGYDLSNGDDEKGSVMVQNKARSGSLSSSSAWLMSAWQSFRGNNTLSRAAGGLQERPQGLSSLDA